MNFDLKQALNIFTRGAVEGRHDIFTRGAVEGRDDILPVLEMGLYLALVDMDIIYHNNERKPKNSWELFLEELRG